MATLPNVEKFLSRTNACGDKVINKNFCGSSTTAWIWELYAFRIWRTFESFDKANPPYVMATGIGADGIVMDEQIANRKMSRCRFYEDRDIPYEMRYQNIDPFEQNQWAEKIQSWGPSGTILPYSNASYDWKSTLDEEGIGILCFYNEIWLSSYSWTSGTGANYSQNWFDLRFRPRQISKNDLIMVLIRSSCSRPCPKETVDPYPCIDPKCKLTSLPAFKDVKDDDEIELPSGEKVKGSEYKKKLEDRAGYKPPCVRVCKDSSLATTKTMVKEYQDSGLSDADLEVIHEIDAFIALVLRMPPETELWTQLLSQARFEKKQITNMRLQGYTWKEVEEHIAKQVNNLNRDMKEKISVLYEKVLYRMWLIREKGNKFDVNFWKANEIKDIYVLAAKHILNHVEFSQTKETGPVNDQDDASESSGYPATDTPTASTQSESGAGTRDPPSSQTMDTEEN